MRRERSTQEAVAAALEHAAACRALARALDYPSDDVRADLVLRASALRAVGTDHHGDALAAVAAVLGPIGEADAELGSEHVRLFGPAGRAPLVESAWTDGGRLLGRAATLADLGGFYRAFGLRPGTDRPRPEDHLAVELEFLGALAVKEAWALAEGRDEPLAVTRDAMASFLREHLGTWVEAWLETLRAQRPPEPYARLGETVARIVRAACERLGVEPAVVAGRPGAGAASAEPFACPLADP